VHLLPAMSSNYSTGAVTGLVARGGFVVDIEWKDLKLVKAKIFSRLGNPLNVTVADSVPFTLQSEGGTGKGAVYTVLPAA
jgi:alpha-L-fucosidase 2